MVTEAWRLFMPLHPALQAVVSPGLRQLLEQADEARDFQPIRDRIAELSAHDSHMQPFAGEEGTKYYKPFVQTVVPKIVPALQQAFRDNRCPEIEILATEIDATRQALGIGAFGSPQDVLYGFTSERYPDWGRTLDGLGFTSACMTGQASAVVCMAPRILELKERPDAEIDELEGAITRDFWESARVVFGKRSSVEDLTAITELFNPADVRFNILDPDAGTAGSIRDLLNAKIADGTLLGHYRYSAEELVTKLKDICNEQDEKRRSAATRRFLRQGDPSPKISQEQIGLKYVDEGKFLQKLLGGARVEHLQSNVKMVKNPMRGNKCEVDSIYRVVGEKRIALVESKDKRRVSRSQLYQLYETYRLRLPLAWDLEVVAVLLEKPALEEQDQGFITYIDLVKIGYDFEAFGCITESLIGVRPEIQYRWKIKRQ